MRCPPGATECHGQKDQEGGDGCKPSDLAFWFEDSVLHPKPPTEPAKPKPPITMAQMPPDCKAVLNAPDARPR